MAAPPGVAVLSDACHDLHAVAWALEVLMASAAFHCSRKAKPSLPEPVVDLYHVGLFRLDCFFDTDHGGFNPIEVLRVVGRFNEDPKPEELSVSA
jgi:hypothetical protein